MRVPPLLITLVAASLVGGCGGGQPWKRITPEKLGRINQHRLLGIALLENDQRADAADEFEQIQKLEPNLAYGYVNRAVALLGVPELAEEGLEDANRGVKLLPNAALPHMVQARHHQAMGHPELAAAALEKAVEVDPRNPRALGALIRHLESQPGEPSPRLYGLKQRLAELTPGNLAAQAGRLEAQATRGEHRGALKTLQRIPALLPQIPAPARALYGRARQALAQGDSSAAATTRQLVNSLKMSPVYRADENALYGNENDPADLAMREWNTPPPALPEPPLLDFKIEWKDRTVELALNSTAVQGIAPVAAGDVDLWEEAGLMTAAGGERSRAQDRPELAVGAPAQGILWNTPDAFTGGGPRRETAASPQFVDLNNDFTLDLYVAAEDGDRVWISPVRGAAGPNGITFKGNPKGAWRQGPRTAGEGPGTVLAVDLDQDGDLDIVRASAAPDQPAVRYLRNNGNFAFTDLTASAGLKMPSQGARQAVFADFDGDGDPDLFVVRSDGGSRLFLNRRQDRFRDATAEWGVDQERGARSASVADFDRDGRWDVVVTGVPPHGTVLYRNTGSGFEPVPEALPELTASSRHDWVEFADYNNDSWLDLVLAGSAGIRLYRNDLGAFSAEESALSEPSRFVLPFDYDMDGDLDLAAVLDDGRLRLIGNVGANRRPWVKVELMGLRKQGPQSNNSFAIGAELKARTPWDDQALLVTRPQTHIGLGRAENVTTLRVLWPHGAPYNRIKPRTREVVVLEQTPRGS